MAKDTTMPKEMCNQVKWLVRQYDKMQDEYKGIAWQESRTEMPEHTNRVNRPVEMRAIRAAYLSSGIQAVDKAIEKLPEYYRQPVLDHEARGEPWPFYADPKTFYRYRKLFLFYVARYMGWY